MPRPSFGNLVFVAFALTQVADGWMTYVGISLYGTSIEANPLIVWYTQLFGAGVALTGAKAIAVFCGVVLHLLARHIVIAFLTATYLVAALWPWTMLLWP